jgi:hypothetical protein
MQKCEALPRGLRPQHQGPTSHEVGMRENLTRIPMSLPKAVEPPVF